MIDLTAFKKGLAVATIVGAARNEAIALGKQEELKQAILPLVAAFRRDGDFIPLWSAIQEVLGEDWAPESEWVEQLGALFPEAVRDVDSES